MQKAVLKADLEAKVKELLDRVVKESKRKGLLTVIRHKVLFSEKRQPKIWAIYWRSQNQATIEI